VVPWVAARVVAVVRHRDKFVGPPVARLRAVGVGVGVGDDGRRHRGQVEALVDLAKVAVAVVVVEAAQRAPAGRFFPQASLRVRAVGNGGERAAVGAAAGRVQCEGHAALRRVAVGVGRGRGRAEHGGVRPGNLREAVGAVVEARLAEGDARAGSERVREGQVVGRVAEEVGRDRTRRVVVDPGDPSRRVTRGRHTRREAEQALRTQSSPRVVAVLRRSGPIVEREEPIDGVIRKSSRRGHGGGRGHGARQPHHVAVRVIARARTQGRETRHGHACAQS